MRARSSRTLLTGVACFLTAASGLALQGVPLPPDTVNQVGLRWDLKTIGTAGAGAPFRFSLCEGRYLAPGEMSGPCHRPHDVNGGHNAPYTFSAGHGASLPEGLRIDGNGVLHGADPALLTRAGAVPLCVRQLDVERCKVVGVGPSTETVPDTIAAPLDNGAGAPKKGHGSTGKILAATIGVAGAGMGIAAAAKAAEAASEDASCGPKPYMQLPPSSAEVAAYRNWCVCLGYRTSGTASNGDYTCLN